MTRARHTPARPRRPRGGARCPAPCMPQPHHRRRRRPRLSGGGPRSGSRLADDVDVAAELREELLLPSQDFARLVGQDVARHIAHYVAK